MRNSKLFLIFALFMILLCCFSAVSASEDVTDDTVAVSDDVAVDEVIGEVGSNDESLSIPDDEIVSSDDSNNELLEINDIEEVDDVDNSSTALSAEENDVEEVDDVDNSSTALSAEENDDGLSGQSPENDLLGLSNDEILGEYNEVHVTHENFNEEIFRQSNTIFYIDEGVYEVKDFYIGGYSDFDYNTFEDKIYSYENIIVRPNRDAKVTIKILRSEYDAPSFNVLYGKNITIENLKFTSERHYSLDGVISIGNAENVMFNNCTFENITNDQNQQYPSIIQIMDGTLYVWDADNYKTKNPVINNCKFINCKAMYIIVDTHAQMHSGEDLGLINISNCIFENSEGTFDGSSLSLLYDANVYLENNTFDSVSPITITAGEIISEVSFKFLTKTLTNNTPNDIEAELVDSNGNHIYASNLKFSVNGGEEQKPTYKNGIYTLSYTPHENKVNVIASCSNIVNCLFEEKEFSVVVSPELTINSTDVITYGDSVIDVNATLKDDINGENVTFSILKGSAVINSITVVVNNGFANATFNQKLNVGSYTLSVTYDGNNNYGRATASKSLTVSKATPDINITVNPIIYVGDEIVVTVTVPEDVRGYFEVCNIANKNMNHAATAKQDVQINNNTVTLIFTDKLGVNEYWFWYTFRSYNTNYASKSIPGIGKPDGVPTFKIVKSNPNLNISADNVDWGNNVTVSISTDSRFTGNITVKFGDDEKIVKIKEGSGSVSFTDLKADTYNVTAKFNETDMFASSQKDINVTVNKVNSTLTLGDDIVFDWNKSGSTTVSYAGATDVNAAINDKEFEFKDGVITVSGLAAGNYTLSVSTVADENHTSITRTVNVRINKVNSTLTLGDDIVFDWNKSGTTNVVSYDGATSVEASVDGGVVSVDGNTITVSGLSAGNHTLSVSTVADENHTSITKTVNVKVNKVNATVSLNDIAFDYGSFNSTTFDGEGIKNVTATILTHPDAKITVSANTITVSGLDAGNYTLEVSVVPDENHNAVTGTVNVTVNKVDSKLTIPDITFTYGESATVSAVISNALGIANASVVGHPEAKVTVNGTNITVSGLNAGTYTLTATTVGDVNYNPVTVNATVTVKGVDVPAAQALSTNVPANSQSPTFSIKLDKDATGNFTVSVDGKVVDTKPLKDGSASITAANLPVGNHNITISYSGDGKYAPITQNTTLTIKEPVKPTPKVTKKATKIVAKKKTFKAKVKVKKYTITLKSGKTLLKKVKVTLKVKGKTYKATTNKKGKATFKIKNLKKKGTYKAVIKFKGNKNYKASSKKVKIKVKK